MNLKKKKSFRIIFLITTLGMLLFLILMNDKGVIILQFKRTEKVAINQNLKNLYKQSNIFYLKKALQGQFYFQNEALAQVQEIQHRNNHFKYRRI